MLFPQVPSRLRLILGFTVTAAMMGAVYGHIVAMQEGSSLLAFDGAPRGLLTGTVIAGLGGDFRRLDPTHRFLVLQMPLLAVLFDLGDRPAPNLRADNAQHRLVRRVDGHERMNEEAQALRIAAPAQIATVVVAPGKVDLGRVLRHDDSAAPARLRGASGRLLQNRLRAHALRPQKAMRRNLGRAVRAKLARRH